MRTLTLLSALLLVSACGKKSAAEPASAPKVQFTAEMPDSPEARKFAKQLTAKPLQSVSPTGSSNFNMDFTFSPDGSFLSDGQAELGGETLECKETGTWSIDAMEGPKAHMDWTIVKTNCPNRDNGAIQRVHLEFLPTDYKISFR